MKRRRPPAFWPLSLALLWGFMEGTWFFLVPDIWLSWLATRSFRWAIWGCILVVTGALLAASIGFLILSMNPEVAPGTLVQFWSLMPGYLPKMSELAHVHLTEGGARGMLSGPNSGIPFRVYVLEAWRLNIPLAQILLWTPMARLERIIVAPLVIFTAKAGLDHWFFPKLSGKCAKRARRISGAALALYWTALYIWYWGFFLPAHYR
jgi:hypothetical protein